MNSADEIIFVTPTELHKEAVLAYKKEFGDEYIHGSAGLTDTSDYEAWLANVRAEDAQTIPNEQKVPASEYLVMRKSDNVLVGMVSIRRDLNDYLRRLGGHIGYSVRASERRKGYGTQILEMALNVCNDLGIENVLVVCEKNNIGSATVIKNNGGKLENEVDDDGEITQRYWIANS